MARLLGRIVLIRVVGCFPFPQRLPKTAGAAAEIGPHKNINIIVGAAGFCSPILACEA
jgi:hypothetical protein